jgi:hypothetical protein
VGMIHFVFAYAIIHMNFSDLFSILCLLMQSSTWIDVQVWIWDVKKQYLGVPGCNLFVGQKYL